MSGDLVIGIDASTTATKAIAWTATGEAVAEGRGLIGLSSPKPNHYEQDAADWWSSACAALRCVTGSVDPARIAAVAIANQRETFAPLDAAGQPVRAGMVWLDERARGLFRELADSLGVGQDSLPRIHRISGKPVDVIPVANRIYWMKKVEPLLHARTAMFADVHAYLVWNLTGRFATSWASADPLGLFDTAGKVWSQAILDAVGIDEGKLPVAECPGSVLGRVDARGSAETGLRAGTPIVAGGGDGQVAGLGAGALTPEVAYLNLGTALVSGIYGLQYLNDLAWRTMGSPTGEGYYYESCVRGGTFTVTWFVDSMCKGEAPGPALFSRLESEASAAGPGAGGLFMLPYWQGVMSPYWDSGARGAFVGLSGAHGRGHLYRALMEGLAFEQHLSTSAVEERLASRASRYVAIGGGASSQLWRQIFADVTGKTVERSATVEATSLGAGMCAAVGAGWFDDFATAAKAMQGRITDTAMPDPDRHAAYRARFSVYRQIYPHLREVFAGVSALEGAAS